MSYTLRDRQPEGGTVDLEFILRQRRAVERDIASYTGPMIDDEGNRISRNRRTNQRGITYVESTRRYRTFAHKPFYFYVGMFKELDVAIQARDAAEAAATQRLEKATPPDMFIRLAKRGARQIHAVIHDGKGRVVESYFDDYDSFIDWLLRKKQRPQEVKVTPRRASGTTTPPTTQTI